MEGEHCSYLCFDVALSMHACICGTTLYFPSWCLDMLLGSCRFTSAEMICTAWADTDYRTWQTHHLTVDHFLVESPWQCCVKRQMPCVSRCISFRTQTHIISKRTSVNAVCCKNSHNAQTLPGFIYHAAVWRDPQGGVAEKRGIPNTPTGYFFSNHYLICRTLHPITVLYTKLWEIKRIKMAQKSLHLLWFSPHIKTLRKAKRVLPTQ